MSASAYSFRQFAYFSITEFYFSTSSKTFSSPSVSCKCFYSPHHLQFLSASLYFCIIMAPFGLLSHGQHLVDEWNKQILVKEYISKNGIPGSAPSTAAPPIVIADDADLSVDTCLLYTSPSPRDRQKSRMPSSA